MPPLEHLIGNPVRYNFNGDPVGTIHDARISPAGDELQLTIGIHSDAVMDFLREEAEHFSFIGSNAGP